MLKKLTLLGLLLSPALHAAPLGELSIKTAHYAVATYHDAVIASLTDMVSYNTVATPGLALADNPQYTGFKQSLKKQAAQLGFDFRDEGHVLVIGLGPGAGHDGERIGLITHGDVQPVDPAKWAKSPFVLDRDSEPGKLIGRGAEDDKGPIATALYAMKAIKDSRVVLKKRIELYIYMAEESDWAPLEAFLKTHVPPQINLTLDAEYPVVTAEKGYGSLKISLPARAAVSDESQPQLLEFAGGSFGSQIPEDAVALIGNATPQLEAEIRQRAAGQKGMRYQFLWQKRQLKISALGVSAHSSKPEDGINAISMLADALAVRPWQGTAPADMVAFLNDMIGTGLYGERFGKIAYHDAFMGPMTVAPTVLKQHADGLELNINLRRPQGKTTPQLAGEVNQAFDAWKARRQPAAAIKVQIGEPWLQGSAPQIPVLLSVFSHFTGIRDAQPVSIGGGTNSRLFPNAVSFGPAMPHTVYTGHFEHEFMTEKQLMLNLEMYTAALVELAS